jgi:hypothetical protein
MSEPFNENSWWRYIIRSKDRLSGTPNNFVVQLPNPIPDNVSDIWVQVQYVAIDSFPNPNDTATVLAQNANSGIFNQGTFSTGNYNNYGFDTGCGVDVCISGVGTMNTIDSELITASSTYVTSAITSGLTAQTSVTIPISNKAGIFVSGPAYGTGVGDQAKIAGITPTMVVSGYSATGVTFQFLPTPGTTTATWSSIASGTPVIITPAQPLKTRQDKTLVFVPYSRGENERSLRLLISPPWTKLSPTNLSTLNIKLFNDKGYPLKLRKFFASATVADINDINIDDWYLEMLVTTKCPLPRGSSQHKI